MEALVLSLPTSWATLTDQQLLDAYRVIAKDYTAAQVRMRLALLWSGLQVVGCNSHDTYAPIEGDDDLWLVVHDKRHYELRDWQLQELANRLSFLDTPPTDAPAPLSRVGAHPRIDTLLSGVPFETYIIIDNFFQGFLHTKDENLLRECGHYLYPGSSHYLPEHITCILYWLVSLKACYAKKFPHFFRPSPTADSTFSGAAVEDAMNAQIRALTQGDITKEAQVLATDTLRALTELNAIARETEEIKKKYPNSQSV